MINEKLIFVMEYIRYTVLNNFLGYMKKGFPEWSKFESF